MPRRSFSTLLVTVVIFCILLQLFSRVCSGFESEDLEQLVPNFLERVAGIDMKNYEVTSIRSSEQLLPNSKHRELVINTIFSNENQNFSAMLTFVDGKFWAYDLHLLSGRLGDVGLGFDSSLINAKEIIEAYASFFNVTHCEMFIPLISSALENQSHILDMNNIVQKIFTDEDVLMERAKLQWFTKISNEFTSPTRSLSMSISRSGFASRIVDNLAVFYVASTDIVASEEDALTISSTHINSYAAAHNQQVESVNVTFAFIRDLGSLRGDIFAIYPSWNVHAIFDRTNNESASGYDVLIWADNGEIAVQQPRRLPFMTQTGDFTFVWLIAVVTAVVIFLTVIGTYRSRRIAYKKSKGVRR